MTAQCKKEEEEELEINMEDKMVEVFCVHHDQDQGIHEPSFSGLEVGKVDDGKKDTWVLAIILLCVSLVLLIAGVVKVLCQTKKTEMREQLVRNIKESLEPQHKEDTLSSEGGGVIEWTIKF